MADGAPPRGRRDFLGAGLVVAAACIFLAAYLLFPVVQGWVSRQDCIASGRVNCGG